MFVFYNMPVALSRKRDTIAVSRYTTTMLVLSANLLGKNVMSLRTGQPVGKITTAIINPNNLKIEGFYCLDRFSKKELVLLYQDIRDVIPQGVVVNDHDVLVEPKELIRLKETLSIGFEILGKQVVTRSKQRLGKVTDFATEVETMYIQKLYVSQGLLKGLTRGSLSVDRSQINEITEKKIIINDLLDSAAVPSGAMA